MQLSPIPTSVESIEDLILWATVALDSKGYPPIALSANAQSAPPVSLMVSRASTGANIGNPYARINLNIPLDNSVVNTEALYASALPFESSDTVPTAMAGTVDGENSGITEPSIYSVPAETWRWFVGEDMDRDGDGAFFNGVSLIGRTGGSATLIDSTDSQDIFAGYFNGIPGLFYPGPNPISGFSLDSSIPSTTWTVVFCGAIKGADSGFTSIISNAEGDIIYIGFNTDFIVDIVSGSYADASGSGMTPDNLMHVWAVTVDEINIIFYLDGAYVSIIPSSSFPAIDFDFLFTDPSGPFFMSDYLIIPRVLSQLEIENLSNDIMAYRGIS